MINKKITDEAINNSVQIILLEQNYSSAYSKTVYKYSFIIKILSVYLKLMQLVVIIIVRC